MFASICKAQVNPETKRANHWYFGNKAGLDFSSGTPVVDFNSQMYQKESGSAVSDDNGNLLFYTNGDTVWNKNHQILANGTGLLNCQSTTQGGLIIKKPSSSNLYYLFTNDCSENNGVNGVLYSTIDMTLNGGLGAITTKNALLYAPSTEKFTATYHCNGTDIWLIGQIRNSNQFCVYLLTNAGISSSPIITSIGYFHNDDSFFILPGTMKFSPNGNKLAVVYSVYPNGIEELYDFDNNTGVISNLIILPSDTSEYGVSFSQDNSKLYIASGNSISRIIQYDLSVYNAASILASRNVVFQKQLINSLLGLQLNNGKIYGALYMLDTLLIINNPNSYSVACNVNPSGISLNGRLCQENLPHYVENYFGSTLSGTLCNVGIEDNKISNEIHIFPNPCSSELNINAAINSINEIVIYNLFNQKILGINNDIHAENSIDLSQIANGIYILEIRIKNAKQIIQLITINH